MKQETIVRIRKFTTDREWEQYHTPANLAKSISIEANELLECFQWSETEYDLEHVKEELADVMVYCRNLLDELGLDEDEIINNKMDQNEAKYPVEKAKGRSEKYTLLDEEPDAGEDTQESGPKRKTFMEWLQDLKNYDLPPNDYNMALMLLFYFRTTSNEHVAFALDQLLHGERSKGDSSSGTDRIYKTYIGVKRYFTSSLNEERRRAGSNDTVEVASYTEKDSAANILLMFREDPEKEMLREVFGGAPNLGNVRRVDCRQIADKPGKGYISFLSDWIDSLGEK